MNLSPYQISLLGGGFILLGALLGNWVAHRFSDFRNRKERRINNYESLQNAFLPSIQILIKEPGAFNPDDFKMFPSHYATQEIAILKVLSNMRRCRIAVFRKKWTEYKEWQKQCKESYEMCVMSVGILKNREAILALINDMLKIARKY